VNPVILDLDLPPVPATAQSEMAGLRRTSQEALEARGVAGSRSE
jgi:hypothetical protein